MKLSQESFLGLKSHFLGVLSAPPSRWLVPVPEPVLLFTSRGALQSSPQGCVVDLGTKESPGRERRTLRVANLGVETLVLAIQDSPSWLTARWLDGGGEAVHLSPGERGAELDLLAEHDGLEETTFLGSIPLLAETLTGEIS